MLHAKVHHGRVLSHHSWSRVYNINFIFIAFYFLYPMHGKIEEVVWAEIQRQLKCCSGDREEFHFIRTRKGGPKESPSPLLQSS